MRWLFLAAPFILAGLASVEWALVMLNPTPFMVGLAVLVTGCFFITIAVYIRDAMR
jgi:hypothetical protein